MSFSDYWEAAILDHVFNKSAYTAPSNIFVALSTADFGEDGSGAAEPSGNGYARVSTAAADWTRTGNTMSNANDVQFPQATGAWGTVTHFGLYDAASGGNFLGSGALGQSKSPVSGDVPKFSAGDLDVTLD